ncbi:Hypothetical protein NTJ_15233 [Nesidiocoris tenuis]|uniref:Uncharacterized protein n=1 Tax=Nesidiocoris tenuis TaxID=355587 RepID=A0ABN7BDG0_9HEMI|nr:Hypothetical protein NTJ_15233 [Nesidiocoris tenuis]
MVLTPPPLTKPLNRVELRSERIGGQPDKRSLKKILGFCPELLIAPVENKKTDQKFRVWQEQRKLEMFHFDAKQSDRILASELLTNEPPVHPRIAQPNSS